MFDRRMRKSEFPLGVSMLLIALVSVADSAEVGPDAKDVLAKMDMRHGVCAVLGLSQQHEPEFPTELAQGSEALVYFQSPEAAEVAAVRQAAEDAGLLGIRVFVHEGDYGAVHLADNLAGAVWVSSSALGENGVNREEVLRVLHPAGQAVSDCPDWQPVTKPFPDGVDAWSHPYHGPDNNPQSKDQVIRHPYLTQFLGYPLFGCISEVTVASGGKMYKAFGHIAFKTAQNEVLNQLYCINGYNGAILWTRPLKQGFMIHRNTMIATPDALFLADDESCKRIDAASGEVTAEIVLPDGVAEGKVWKWMAMDGGVLYALLGGEEVKAEVKRANTPGFGHWPWGMWKGYDYQAGVKAYGMGRDLVAIDPQSGRLLWHHREEELVDSRGLCMTDDRIYYYCPGKFLACRSAADGEAVWKTSDERLLEAIAPHERAQNPRWGFASSVYLKSNGKYLLFSGPQRRNLVAVSCQDGQLAWFQENGNFQLVLRDDALYAVGSQGGTSFKRDYDTGEVLEQWTGRRACTRATGSLDSIFYRASGGTIRYAPGSGAVEHIAPMRPPCHDGVIISDGMLYWGPWICGCHLSLYGNIALSPAGDFDSGKKADESEQLQVGPGDLHQVGDLKGQPVESGKSTACGGLVFMTGPDGVVKATNADDKSLVWKTYTGGGINFPPAVWRGRVYVGSGDGWVYALEATTGRRLWRFRAAPAERVIPVYGRLMSTWPVAGGVVVEDGVVYAAAGIAHYDGTHVYALDAITGKIRWHNNTSGALAECKNGVSLQGRLRLEGAKLTFCGGNAYPQAVFDAATGKCLTAPHGPNGTRASTFYAVNEYMEKVRRREAERRQD